MQISGVSAGRQATGTEGVHGRHHGPRMDPQKLADALGVSADDLRAAREKGRSLADFAKEKGISGDTLLSAVKARISEAGSRNGMPALSDDQLTAMATDMVNRTPGRHRGHHGPPPPDGADAATGTSEDLSQLQGLLKAISDGDQGDAESGLSRLMATLRGGSSAYSGQPVGLDSSA